MIETVQRWGRLALLTGLLLLLAACRNGSDVPPAPVGEPVAQARVTVEGTGLFKVEPRALSALGWTADDPLAMTINGKALPLQAQEGALYFYLPERTPSVYSNQHTLWITHGQAMVPGEVKAATEPLATLTSEQRLGGQVQYSPKYMDDPWFWRTLVGPTTDEQPIETPGRVAGTVTITARFGGVTNTPHTVHLLLEGQELGTLQWYGDKRYEQALALDMPAGEALALSFVIPEPDGGADISMLDDILIRYPSAPTGIEGIFRGSAPQAGVADFAALGKELLAWQIEPGVVALPVTDSQVTLPAEREVIVAERKLAQPVTIQAAEVAAIPSEGAEYVAIVVPSLVEAVEPLLGFQRDQGLSTMLVTPQQVYDAYSHGTVDPLAFRALLKDGQETWTVKPRFVLLVGDSTYDPLGNQNPLPATYLPSPFIETVFGGETVSDNMIADLDEDGYPDVALGRLPAQTVEQLSTYIEKRIAYSMQPPAGDWQQRILLAADGQEELFKNHSERLREDIPAGIETLAVYPEAESDAATEMLPALNEGSLVVNYVGHGSVQQWGKDRLLTAQGASELSNAGRLPIFINMTCLAGLFSHPTQESLAESLLWAAGGGAVATVAPTSLTLPTNQTRLNEALILELFAAERPYLGEALDRAKRTVPLSTPNDHDIVATFNLLGDPALQPLSSVPASGG